MTPEPKMKGKTDEERWALGSSLHPDEQRYVLELFPESRGTLKLSPEQWLAQTEFLVKKDGSLDLRKRYCRLPGEPDRRFHRAPRYEPLPAPPRRQRTEWDAEAIEAALLTRTPEGRGNYTETVSYKFAHGDLTREGAARAMGAPLAVVPIFWGPQDHERLASQQSTHPQPQLPPGVAAIVDEALTTGDLVKANERLFQLSGGKTIRQVANEWAQQIQAPAEPEQREQQQPQQPDPQLPPAEPRPSRPAEENAYGVRIWNAYRELAEQYQAIDVPIHALHRRVGGSLLELQNHLRAECLGHRAVATTGEPAFAGDAARQSALRLPGASETFLNIKLLNPPPMPQPPPEPQRQVASLNRDDLAVIIEALEYRCDAIEGGTDFDEVARLKSIVPTLEKLRVLEAQPQRPEHERYESLLRATAALRYPAEERTAELEARIEKTIARKVGEFTQERRAKAYEAGLRKELAQRHPNLTPDQAQRYERRINELVAQFRENQAQQQQQAQPPLARCQEQGRGIEQSL